MNLLPARVDQVPEVIRRLHASTGLEAIAREAAAQNALNQYSEAAGHEVVAATTQLNLPEEAEEIHQLFVEVCLSGDDIPPELVRIREHLTGKMSPSDAARMLTNSEKPADVTVERGSIKQDLLAKLHPDRKPEGGVDAEDLETYKAIAQGQADGDDRTVQGRYAEAVARSAPSESGDIAGLELRRYKAWVALQASRGRFQDEAAVDQWKEQEVQTMGIKSRISLTTQLSAIFIETLGIDPQSGNFTASGPGAHELVNEMRRVQQELSRITELSHEEMAAADSTDAFDERVPAALQALKPLVRWSGKFSFAVSSSERLDAAYQIRRLCETLCPVPAPESILPRSTHERIGECLLANYVETKKDSPFSRTYDDPFGKY